MKKVIELLEGAKLDLIKFSRDHSLVGFAMCALSNIEESLYELKAPPRWETPEEWEKRTGKTWPDDWAVYALYENNDVQRQWFWGGYGKERDKAGKRSKNPMAIVCATESGKPPDGWRPGELRI
jgi:hypothetical protein